MCTQSKKGQHFSFSISKPQQNRRSADDFSLTAAALFSPQRLSTCYALWCTRKYVLLLPSTVLTCNLHFMLEHETHTEGKNGYLSTLLEYRLLRYLGRTTFLSIGKKWVTNKNHNAEIMLKSSGPDLPRRILLRTQKSVQPENGKGLQLPYLL